METQAGLYGLFKWLLDSLFSSSISTIAVPGLMIAILLKFFDWARRSAKGERAQYLNDDFNTLRSHTDLSRRPSPPSRRSSPRRR